MEIILNGEKESLDKEYTVNELLKKLDFNPEIVTVSLTRPTRKFTGLPQLWKF